MAGMLGNSGGPQGFINGTAAEQQLAQQGADVLAQSQASKVVANVFRAPARRALDAERAAARRPKALKVASESAVAGPTAAAQAPASSPRPPGRAPPPPPL